MYFFPRLKCLTEPNDATSGQLPPFFPPPGSPQQAAWPLSARWRHMVLINPRPSLKSRASLPSKLREAMASPLWRLLDTEPLEGIGPGRAGW